MKSSVWPRKKTMLFKFLTLVLNVLVLSVNQALDSQTFIELMFVPDIQYIFVE